MITRNLQSVVSACLLSAFVLLFIGGCGNGDSLFVAGTSDQKKELKILFRLLAEENEPGENRFVILSQIARILASTGNMDRMNLFLTTYAEKNPHDPFNAYYLFLVARNHQSRKAYPLAAYYFDRILKNHPDLLVRGESIHLSCLQELIKLVDKPQYRVSYFKELLSRFSDKIDTSSSYFSLAKTYEQIGEWDQALHAYTRFLQNPGTSIPGYPDAYKEANNNLAFYNSSKSWTRETIDDLINEMKRAITMRDSRVLEKYRAKVNFFAMSWDQEETDANSQVVFDLGTFLRQSKVFYAQDLDIDSNAHEAYLRTWGWSYRIPVWYLYFRKIRFPADPEINGRWEWAGIYFGEKL